MFGIDDLAGAALMGAGWGGGFVVVVAAAAVAGPRARPLAKRAMRGYLAASERMKDWTAESSERLRDLYAEARYEYEHSLTDGEGAAAGTEEAVTEPATASTAATAVHSDGETAPIKEGTGRNGRGRTRRTRASAA